MALYRTSFSCNGAEYDHYYLCHYRRHADVRDKLSHSLMKFKMGRQPDLDAWTDCALETFKDLPLPPNILILRALRHQETIIEETTTPLDGLGRQLAARYGHHYHPQLLQKARATTPVKNFTRQQREDELQGLYIFHPHPFAPSATPSAPRSAQPAQSDLNPAPAGLRPDPASAAPQPHPLPATFRQDPLPGAPQLDPAPANPIPSHFLLIDDILTSGATMRAIISCLPAAKITLFTLTRTDDIPASALNGARYTLQPGHDWTLAETATPHPFT